MWRAGDNDATVLDLAPNAGSPTDPSGTAGLVIEIRDEPDLGPVAPPPVVD